MALVRLAVGCVLLAGLSGAKGPASAEKKLNKDASKLSPSGDVQIAFVNGNEPQSPSVQEAQTEMSELRASKTPEVGHDEKTQPSRCPLSKDLDRPEPVPELVRCPEYRENSCCSQKEDASLDADFISAYEYIFSGCAGCLENFRLFQCAMRCAPDQASFVTLASKSAAKSGNTATVRMCPQFCSRFYRSCVNTTSRAVFHADDGTFCASQVDTAGGIEVAIDQFSCINSAGPSYCNGEYIHEVESEETWTTKQIVKACVLGIILALTLCCGAYFWFKGPDHPAFTKEKEHAPYLVEKLHIPGIKGSE